MRISVALTTCVSPIARERSSARQPVEARPQPDVRRRRPLRLDACRPLDRLGHRQPVSAEQELPRERRAIELAERERSHRREIVRTIADIETLCRLFRRRTEKPIARCASRSSSSSSRSRGCSRSTSTVVDAARGGRVPRARSRREARTGDRRGRVRQERLDRARRAARAERRMSPAEAALRELTQGPTRVERRKGIRTALPEGARLRSLRTDGERGSRASRGRRSALARPRRSARGSGRSRPRSRSPATRSSSRSRRRVASDDCSARRPTRYLERGPGEKNTPTSCAASSFA